MCRNHSHIIARFLGEDTTGARAVLMFALEKVELIIEGGSPYGAKIIVPTTGMLYLPSMSLDGSLAARQRQTEAPLTSLCLLPGADMTTMQQVLEDLEISLGGFVTTPLDLAASPIPVTGGTAEDDVPF